MKTPLEIAISALEEILDVEKSASVGWNAVNVMNSIARRALQRIAESEQMAIDRAIENDAFPNK